NGEPDSSQYRLWLESTHHLGLVTRIRVFMNDMRLPGVSLVNNEPSVSPSNDAPRDPAQAFDAVMSRFANDRSAPASNTNPSVNNNANRGSGTNRTNNNADDSSKNTRDTKATGETNNNAASGASR